MTTIQPLPSASEQNGLPADTISAQTDQPVKPQRATRRRLTPEQQREVARLYADSTTPTSEIRKRFGIGESSLYRIVQRQGVPLRGRSGSTQQTAPAQVQAPAPRRTTSGRRGRGPGVSQRTPSADGRVSAAGSGGRVQFQVAFQAERVIQARDIWEALRQAEALGATEVTAVTRAD